MTHTGWGIDWFNNSADCNTNCNTNCQAHFLDSTRNKVGYYCKAPKNGSMKDSRSMAQSSEDYRNQQTSSSQQTNGNQSSTCQSDADCKSFQKCWNDGVNKESYCINEQTDYGGGKSEVVHYMVTRASHGGAGGDYTSKSGPAAAAKKAASKRFAATGASSLTLTVRRKGSDREFSYRAKRVTLAKPVVRTIAGKQVVSRYEVQIHKAG